MKLVIYNIIFPIVYNLMNQKIKIVISICNNGTNHNFIIVNLKLILTKNY